MLRTKLYIPPLRPDLVSRSHLIAQLNAGLHRKLTLVSAPAGFGKTTLLSAWVAAAQCATAWLSLDESDSDPSRFLLYLVAAVQTIAPTLGIGALAALQSPHPPPAEAILTALLNDSTTLPDKAILVLDDYHVIDAKLVDTALAFLLDHLPPQLHLVIATREDPQLPLARLRARGQLTELRAAELRFTPAEAAAFLTEVMAIDLSAEDVAALERRTEGWIAGLQLAALSMRGRDDTAQFVRAFAGDNRYIVEYLVEEVLQRQPPHVQRFLLQTSILQRLHSSLCDAVTGQNDGKALLDALQRGNLFVVPLDDTRHWFRYHHLFADVLATHLRAEQPDLVATLHRRASAWYADNGLPADAIHHALAANDFARAADLVELAWPAMDGRFQAATWLKWAKALPDELIRVRPVLSVAYAWALLNGGALEAAEARLCDAERWLEALPSIGTERAAAMVIADAAQFQALPASIATARAYLHQARGDLFSAVAFSQRALDLLPAGDHLRRGPAAALLGLAHWARGELEDAHRALADAMANFQTVGNLHFAISGTYGLADIRTVQGRLHAAVRTYTQVLQLALEQGEPLLRGTADLYLGLSELSREQGDLKAAREHLLRSEELGERAGLPDWRYRLCRAQARFKATEGDLEGALERLEAAERHYYRTPVPDLRPLAALKAQLWLAQGRIDQALHWAQAQGLSADDEMSFLREFDHITLARVLLAEYRRDGSARAIREATHLLARLQQAAAAGGRMGSAIEIAVVQALAHTAQGERALALVALERALRLAAPEGYVRIFVDEGPAMERLILEVFEHLSGAAVPSALLTYIRRVLSAFPAELQDEQAHRRVRSNAQPLNRSDVLVEPLSARELDVLQLIAQGLSNDEISARLFLAVSTVKGHNRNIFDKLGVQRRTEAVARARELGLL
jgi:LuxR family transcriptional regulator, maltose regulon positive regulatory protein